MLLTENDVLRTLTKADSWHKNGYKGKNTTIVILDGQGKAHEHMNYYTDVFDKEKESGHGVDVAQVIHEFAPEARIYMFNWNSEDKWKIIQWIKERKDEIDLINISLAGTDGAVTGSFVLLRWLGIPMICAGGNDYFEDKISYPAKFTWTIAVGAYNHTSGKIDNYSNEGDMLDVAGTTGVHVRRADGKLKRFFGTSCATPAVTGLLACYIQLRKETNQGKLGVEEAREFLRSNTIDIEEVGFDKASGMGLFILPSKITKKLELELFIDKENAIKNGEAIELRIAPEISKGRTMLGIRDIAELMDCTVSWDGDTKKVTITKEDTTIIE